MAYFIRIQNGNVKDVWDYLPAHAIGNPEWVAGIDVKPVINPLREAYGTHYFNLTATPVEVVWPVRTLSVAERREELFQNVLNLKQRVIELEMKLEQQKSEVYYLNTARIAKWFARIDTGLQSISGINTHNGIDNGLNQYNDFLTKLETISAGLEP